MSAFANKVAVITGGNSGIGLATAKEFSRQGAKVVISGRDERTLAAAAAAIGGNTLAVRADVSRLADLDKLFVRTKERFGGIDVLFVNAGGAKFASVEETTEAVFDEVMDINFKGAFFTVQKALPNSVVAAMYTPSRTTRLTRFNEPSCFLASAISLRTAVRAAARAAFVSRSLPTMPALVAVWPTVASMPLRNRS